MVPIFLYATLRFFLIILHTDICAEVPYVKELWAFQKRQARALPTLLTDNIKKVLHGEFDNATSGGR